MKVRPLLEEISGLLARMGTAGSFVSHEAIPAENLRLEVEDFGRIRLPVSAATARKLCQVARPARYGLKDETRLDRGVRDTWEIPGSRITVDDRRWEGRLATELERIRRELGLPAGCRFKARLQNLLIYAAGQFFVTHQDSERADDMIATLIVGLPSHFRGGAMVIKHQEEKKLVGGSARDLTLIAFYADCYHEVRPVKEGYRVVLTYNLYVEGDTTVAEAPATRTDALAGCIGRFFETPSPPRWSGDGVRSPPDRLVYLLDHQYTRRGLAWERLKNSDAARAGVLREIARRLDCEIDLALADVHETWASEDEYREERYGRRWGYDDEEDDQREGGSGESHRLTELIESDIELRHATGRRPRALAAAVSLDELCYTKPSVELEPFESEHEGYMGNYGNTVDRWYHRAAIVLWPRDRRFVIRARGSPYWGIGEVAKRLRRKAADPEALNLARRLLPFWGQIAWRDESPGTFAATLAVAATLGDAEVATALLQPFALTSLTAKTAPRFAELLDKHGEDWCRTLLRQWTLERRAYEAPDERLTWMSAGLAPLCQALCRRPESSGGPGMARWILKEQWTWLLEHTESLEGASAKEMKKELARLSAPVLAVVESARIDSEVQRSIVDFLADDTDHLELLRLGLLRAAHERHGSNAVRAVGLKSLHTRCARDLARRVNAPPRAADDWSIRSPLRCSCKLCGKLKAYLRAPRKIRLEWPLAKEGRAHIHRAIDSQDLSVRHITRRVGRPFTLVLEKTPVLFERDAAERRAWETELKWLEETAGDF